MKPKKRSPRFTVNLPGHLHDAVQRRWQTEQYLSQSDYVLGLIIWDIYNRQPHTTTGPLMREPSWKVAGFVHALLKELGEPPPPPGDVVPYRFNVTVPDLLVALAETRSKEERYRSTSAYVTGLVIFDLKRRAPDPKKVPHHKTTALLREPFFIRQWAFVHIAHQFGNSQRVWPKDIQGRIDELVRDWKAPTA